MKTIKEHNHNTQTCKLCESMRNAGRNQSKEQIYEMIEEEIDDITAFKLNEWKEDAEDIEIKDKTLNFILKEELLSKIRGEE